MVSNLKSIIIISLTVISIQSCTLIDKWLGNEPQVDTAIPVEKPIEEPEENKGFEQFKVSRKLNWELIHTELDLTINWEKHHLNGVANLQLKPYGLNKTSQLELDAKSMIINSINCESVEIDGFTYLEHRKLIINFTEPLDSSNTVHLHIQYTACPDSIDVWGLNANHDQKGLYFINPNQEEIRVPTQLWTQGETEYSSFWFPTIDQPNVKTTQSVRITVDTPYTALSNGRLVYMMLNEDGSRTFKWKQEKPHAPYLFMLGVGEFSQIETSWRDSVPVNYYVERAYASLAELTFGNTPEMMEFFSGTFGVDYPWDKYSQMVVRDFVSGAMENTGAVLHMSSLQRDTMAHNDASYEDYVSHELAHQWFGNLVTCKSWANLTLNEAFASYAEYLWNEHKYGEALATETLIGFRRKYFGQSTYNAHPLIQYRHNEPDDMFDAHSYDKGALVLHLLRNTLGENVWRAGIKHYLQDNAYGTVDVHDLQKAFEKASGRQLDQFFFQWFYQKGHPELKVNYQYVDSNKTLLIVVEQNSDNAWPIFSLSPKLSVMVNGELHATVLQIDSMRQSFVIQLENEPDWVQLDMAMQYPCRINEIKPQEWWIAQTGAGFYRARLSAWIYFEDNHPQTEQAIKEIIKQLAQNDKIEKLDVYGLLSILDSDWEDYARSYPETKTLILEQDDYVALATSIPYLETTKNLVFEDLSKLYQKQSYVLRARCLHSMANLNYDKAHPYLLNSLGSGRDREIEFVAKVVSLHGKEADFELVINAVKNDIVNLQYAIDFLENCEWNIVLKQAHELKIISELNLGKNDVQSVENQLVNWKRTLQNKPGEKPENLGLVINIIDEILANIGQ